MLVDTSAMDFDESRRAILDVIREERGSVRPRNKFYEFIWSILRPIFSLLHPLRVEGLENVPQEGPVLLCRQPQQRHGDPILLVIALGPALSACVSWPKKQLLKIPVLGVHPARDRGLSASTAATRTSAPSKRPSCSSEGRVRTCCSSPRGRACASRAAVAAQGRRGHDRHPLGRADAAGVHRAAEKALFLPDVPIIFGKPYDPQYTGRKRHGGRISGQRRGGHAAGLCAGRDHMKVIHGKERGLLLRRASARCELAEQTARERGGCVMLGQHHPQRARRASSWSSWARMRSRRPEEIRPGDTVLIRAHGEPRQVIGAPGGHGRPSAWTPPVRTCSASSSSSAQADAEGRVPIIIGEPNHPEVMGVASWCGAQRRLRRRRRSCRAGSTRTREMA